MKVFEEHKHTVYGKNDMPNIEPSQRLEINDSSVYGKTPLCLYHKA